MKNQPNNIILTICVSLVIGQTFGQNINPDADEIFIESEIAEIHLVMSADDKIFMLDDENIWSDEYLPAKFRFVNSLMDTSLMEDVGIRLRGNSSRDHPKRSFKIKFKEFDGDKFFGHKKFNLKAENNDPTFVREMLTMQTFRKSNVPAARTHHAKVYINNEYMGIYVNVEQIDDEFLESRFGDDNGNLYKCAWGANLLNSGQATNDDIYELKTNEDENDRLILMNFISVLNSTSSDNFEEEIEKVFNVDAFIKHLAVEVMTGHWDGYSYNKNNYYLYENPVNSKVEFIPYDVDNTFGLDWVNRDWGTRDILDWVSHGDPRPLSSKILANPKYFDQYVTEMQHLLNNDFTESYFFPLFDGFKSRLSDAVMSDTYFPQTFGFSFSDFENGYTIAVADHAPYGVKPYVTTRIEHARSQLATITSTPEWSVFTTSVYPNPSNGFDINLSYTSDIQNKQPINVFDIYGKNLSFSYYMKSPKDIQLSFDSKLKSGVYFIADGNQNVKFFVK